MYMYITSRSQRIFYTHYIFLTPFHPLSLILNLIRRSDLTYTNPFTFLNRPVPNIQLQDEVHRYRYFLPSCFRRSPPKPSEQWSSCCKRCLLRRQHKFETRRLQCQRSDSVQHNNRMWLRWILRQCWLRLQLLPHG